MTQQYSTTALRSLWAKYKCKAGGGWSSPTVFGRPIGGVPTILVPAYNALEQALEVAGYHPPHGDSVWAYNCRLIAGTSSYSLHSYGLAIDIDPVENPFTAGDPYSGQFKRQHVDAVMGIKTNSGRGLWYWGGYWSKPDRMHFQIDNTPTDCQPDWSTVPEPEEDDLPLNDADLAKIRGIVDEELDKLFVSSADNTTRISRTVWQHGGGFSGATDPKDNAQLTVKRIEANTKPE